MKSVLFAIFFLLSLFSFSQNTISEIDSLVARIKINKPQLDLTEEFLESGNKQIYKKNENTLLVSVTENGKIEKNVCWYFRDSQLMHTETIWSDAESGRQLFQERSYHKNNRMFAWLDSESSFVDASSPRFIEMDKKMRAYVDNLLTEPKKSED